MGSTTKNTNALDEIPDIRFFQLGLLDWILQRIGLLNKPEHGYLRRIVFVVLICWIPLFILCLIEETVIGSINDLVIPYLERIRKRTSDKKSRDYLSLLEQNLGTITSSFFRKLTTKYANLTSTEIEVANLAKNGKSIKEIADFLCISGKTVEVHRMNIRKKMGIANTKTSLRSHLLSLA